MATFGPFEYRPRLAVAVSGGTDSMALLLLARRWVQSVEGDVVALVADHGLRLESGAEARGVARWCRDQGIDCRILTLTLNTSGGNIQHEARDARYRALFDWCRDHSVLHLLVAHHRDDQAETLMLRLARGSGLEGLTGMAPEVVQDDCRLLRPLLDFPKTALIAEVTGLPVVHDPSNRNRRFARVQVRQAAPDLAALGLTAARLAVTTEQLARSEGVIESLTDRAKLRHVRPHPAGWLRIDVAGLGQEPEVVAHRLLSRVAAWVGGTLYPPRYEGIEALWGERDAARERTLGGALWLPKRGGQWLVCREPAAIAGNQPLSDRQVWDGRFLAGEAVAAEAGWRIGAVGADAAAFRRRRPWPSVVIQGLPMVEALDGSRSIPHLSYQQGTPAPALVHRPLRRFVEGRAAMMRDSTAAGW